ncbi:MAG: VOC family protein [Alphaproteobacteria bacterium]|jgi:catechol-2,3-dioxygenase
MTKSAKPRAIGINHVALEVGNIGEAIEFYGKLFDVNLRSQSETDAFIGLGDQFIALFKSDSMVRDTGRHFGLVVDDPAKGRAILEDMGVEFMSGPGVNFNDPWGNYVQLVTYEKIQFDKTPGVLRGMGLNDLEKTAAAKQEIADNGFGND